jgi:hypothetical protein
MITKESITILINPEGYVDKNKLLEVHTLITNNLKLSQRKINLDYGFYIVRVLPFITNLNFSTVLSIMDLYQSNIMIKIKITDLMDYCNIAKSYINVNILQKQNIICTKCFTSNINEKIEGEYLCENCGFIYDTRLPGIKDLDSINSCRSYYSLKSNLLKVINKYENNTISISNEEYEKILNEIKIRKIPIDILKSDHLFNILKDLKLTKYYNEVYQLLLKITKREHNSIKKYIPQILKLHDELEYTYNFVKNPKRINSLNVHFKLQKLLELCGIECSDINSLKTDQKLEEHEDTWREICLLNENFKNFIN